MNIALPLPPFPKILPGIFAPSGGRPLPIPPARYRHLFTVDGRALYRKYLERPVGQVEAICRRQGGYTIPLWRTLKSQGRVRHQVQRLDPVARIWRQVP